MKLTAPLDSTFRLTEAQKKALKRLGLERVRDLLYHFPSRYDTPGSVGDGELAKGAKVTLYGTIGKAKTSKGWRTKIPMAEATIDTPRGKIKAVWFHQPYIAKMYGEGAVVKVEGTLSERKGELYLSNPHIEKASAIPQEGPLFEKEENSGDESTASIIPVYPESRGITSRWFYYTIQKVIASGAADDTEDPIPADILKRYNLPRLATALVWMHAPQSTADADAARKRFAFEEIFFIQLGKQRERAVSDALPTWDIRPAQADLDAFLARFPFKPTQAQSTALEDILKDFSGARAMSRLLEGDVGSGKTFVAAASAFAAVTTRPERGHDFGNLQAAIMAPTEILATQHFESFVELFRNLPIQIGLITSSGCRKFPSKVGPTGWTDISRAQLLKWVGNGEIPILIGTHALIQKTVKWKHLAYVVIDEQHRFGTKQRMALARKDDKLPHLLSMTATPIPRTLALTIYGDLDLSLLDEMPPGRKPIITESVPIAERTRVYEHVRSELAAGRQAYVICPRIDEPDPTNELAIQAKSVEEETKRLARDVFPEYRVSPLHGKMKSSDKERIMEEFARGTIDVLVATSVIEVGVNVPNATIIIIEGAERFGLSQLHQLRGRVLRSSHQAHCYLFTESKAKTTLARLKALTTAKNGFELAERDLMLRGAGDLSGRKQWGVSDLGMEALKNLKLVEAARNEAKRLIEEDRELVAYPVLKKAADEREGVHFE